MKIFLQKNKLQKFIYMEKIGFKCPNNEITNIKQLSKFTTFVRVNNQHNETFNQ